MVMNQTRKSAVFAVNFAVLLFGLAGIFAKWIQIPSLGITFGRVVFSSLTLLIYQLVTHKSLRLADRSTLLRLLLAGVLLAIHWWTFLGAIKISTVAIGTITFSSFPLFVTFMEPLFFHERLKGRNILTAILILIGVIITVPELELSNTAVQGILVGMLSAFAYSVLTLMNRRFTESLSGTTIAFYEQAAAALFLLPFVLRAKITPSGSDLFLLLLLGVFTTALAHTLFIGSLKQIPARLAGVCSSMETVYGIALAALILGEMPGIRELLGGILILGTVVGSQLLEEK